MNRWDRPFPRTGCNLDCRLMLAHSNAPSNPVDTHAGDAIMLADAARASAVLHLSHPAHRGSVLAIGPVVTVDARLGAPDARRLPARHRHARAPRRGNARRRPAGGLSVRRRRDPEAHRSTKQLSSADAALQGSRRLRNAGGDARVPPANLTGIPRRSSVHRRDPTEDCYRTPLETRAPGLATSDILVPRIVRM
jgi:hypothetical protein